MEGLNLEGLRRKLRKLAEMEEEIMAELSRIFADGDEGTICLTDPTYLRETEERLLVFAVYDENNPLKAYKKRMRINVSGEQTHWVEEAHCSGL